MRKKEKPAEEEVKVEEDVTMKQEMVADNQQTTTDLNSGIPNETMRP